MKNTNVDVEWLVEDRYVPKLGIYKKGVVKPMPKGLAARYEEANMCRVLDSKDAVTKDVKAKKEVK